MTTVTSVTYCYSPSLRSATDTLPLAPSYYLAPPTNEECLFSRQGDYWVIRYQGQMAFLKASRGLQFLSLLLSNPGREFHVSELFRLRNGKATRPARPGEAPGVFQRLPDAGAILDAQAKTEYRTRLRDLRRDLEEAECSSDLGRTEQIRGDIDFISRQLASAVGFGGHDRRLGSEAERARCAVTKRIKDSINKIGEAIPSFRRHLAAQIKTGYFCSYNVSQEYPVLWKLLILLTALCCDTESYTVT